MGKLVAAALALVCALLAPRAWASDGPVAEGNIIFHAGARGLNAGFWSPLENQGTLGVEFDYTPAQWPVGFVAGFMAAADKRGAVVISDGIPISADFEMATAEFDFGPRSYFHLTSWLDFYLNAGISVFSTAVKVSSQWTETQTSSFSAVGAFYGAGAVVRLGSITAGLDARGMSAPEITLFGDKGKADYTQFCFTLGWRF